MIISLRKLSTKCKFAALFLVLTYVLIQLFDTFGSWIAPVDRYREPQGRAVKVFQTDLQAVLEPASFTERLRLFYWLGE
ncbi:DUF4227 family protein [Paenibacillus sp. 481]|uniref:DUF4227 family protein n=1 Tax=Paenibacillus sp. 481 TaxID=2835869 RepID=UPI001E43277D|nr:DUF4227 family protein [Paenibacillus sp. 481]UHA72906.1 DUF4227 family protein [Paenibacillus sp. 481]